MEKRMIYIIKSKCEESPQMDDDDGNITIYLYTKGMAEKDRKPLHDMLKYMERSTSENAVSEPLKEIQNLVEEIQKDEEIGVSYMKWWEREAYFRKEGREEGRGEGEQLQLIKMVCKKLEKNKAVAQIADELETEEAEIVKIIEAAREFAPEYDAEKILEKLSILK